ncbi:MAG: hypothetical protein ACOVSI_10015 [Gemmatimonas sp.]|jgi:hypothetical protein
MSFSRHRFRPSQAHTPRRAAAVVGATLALSTLAGCFRYLPLDSTAVPARTEIRLVFTADGARALRDSAGFELRQLDGVAVRTLADSAIVVRPGSIITADGNELQWRRGDLMVPWRTVDRSQQRTMDKRRTRRFAVVMGAVFSGVVYFALRSIAGGGGTTSQPGGGVPE